MATPVASDPGRYRIETQPREKTMKPSVGSFGYQFRLLDFTVRSSLAIVLGVVGCVTFYGAFW
ncbi:hypothetical protein B0E45_10985 [Sinorhizobium sp. A49]|nr:hypothetical protein B0E45_10985 [Sinorhizobium sp. A49]